MRGQNINVTGSGHAHLPDSAMFPVLLAGGHLDAPDWVPAGSHINLAGAGVSFEAGQSVLRNGVLW